MYNKNHLLSLKENIYAKSVYSKQKGQQQQKPLISRPTSLINENGDSLEISNDKVNYFVGKRDLVLFLSLLLTVLPFGLYILF